MRDITLHRYLYVLIKMFSLNGNTVILPLYKELIKILNNQEFVKYKEIIPKNIEDIKNLSDYVSLKVNSLSI